MIERQPTLDSAQKSLDALPEPPAYLSRDHHSGQRHHGTLPRGVAYSSLPRVRASNRNSAAGISEPRQLDDRRVAVGSEEDRPDAWKEIKLGVARIAAPLTVREAGNATTT